MTENEQVAVVVSFWVEKAHDALASARSELEAGRLSFAVNRMYYACFYAASARFLAHGIKFAKHSGVRTAVHRDLVRTKVLSLEDGRLYDRLFVERQEADYLELTEFEPTTVRKDIEDTERLVGRLCELALGHPRE